MLLNLITWFLLCFIIGIEEKNLPAPSIEKFIEDAKLQANPPESFQSWKDYFKVKGWKVTYGGSGILKTFENISEPYEKPSSEECIPRILDMFLCRQCRNCQLDWNALHRECRQTNNKETKKHITILMENGTLNNALFHVLGNEVRSRILGNVPVTLSVDDCSTGTISIHYARLNERQNGSLLNVASIYSHIHTLFILEGKVVVSNCDTDKKNRISYCVPAKGDISSYIEGASPEPRPEPKPMTTLHVCFFGFPIAIVAAYIVYRIWPRGVYKGKRDEEEEEEEISLLSLSPHDVPPVEEPILKRYPTVAMFDRIHDCVGKFEARYLKDSKRFGEIMQAITSNPRNRRTLRSVELVSKTKVNLSKMYRNVHIRMKSQLQKLSEYVHKWKQIIFSDTSSSESNYSRIYDHMNESLNIILTLPTDYYVPVDKMLSDMLSKVKEHLKGTDFALRISGSPWQWPETNYKEKKRDHGWTKEVFCERMVHLGSIFVHISMMNEYQMNFISSLDKLLMFETAPLINAEADRAITVARDNVLRKYIMARKDMKRYLLKITGIKLEMSNVIGLFSEEIFRMN